MLPRRKVRRLRRTSPGDPPWAKRDPAQNARARPIRPTVEKIARRGHREAGGFAMVAPLAALVALAVESEPRSKARSRADWKRSSGFFSRQWETIRSRPGGIWRPDWASSGGSSLRIAFIVSIAVSP